MKSVKELPGNYEEVLGIDLAGNKKLAGVVSLMALAIAAVAVTVGCLRVSLLSLFDMTGGLGKYLMRFGILIAGMLVYILLHEAVHGVFMYLFSSEKPFFGISPMYAYAGSRAYFGKTAYLTIALSPVVFWGIALGVVGEFVSQEWFWVVYAVQVINLSGAAGDLYVFFRFLRLPREILVKDTGVAMTVYAPALKGNQKQSG